QKPLPRLRALGQQHRQNVVIIAPIEHGAVGEDRDHQAARAAETQIQPNACPLGGVAVDLLRNLNRAPEDASAGPMLLICVLTSGAGHILHPQGSPLRVVQTRLFRMGNVIMKTPLRFGLVSERYESVQGSFISIRRIALAQPGSSIRVWKEA